MREIVPEIEAIVNFYKPEVVEGLARETGFVQRESKLGGIEFLGIMTQGLYSQPDASLSQLVAMLKDMNPELEISPEGLHHRIAEPGVEFLKVMLSKALELSVVNLIDESVPGILEHFGKVHLLDSTQMSLPGELSWLWSGSGGCASESGIKLHLMLDYKSGGYESICITDGTSPDQNYIDEAIKRLNPGELLIDDLGYFKQEAVMDIDQRGAYFLFRFNHQNNLYKKEDGKLVKFDLLSELMSMQKEGKSLCEFDVYFQKKNRQTKMRLICEMVSEEVAEDRRKNAIKAAKKKGRKPTGKHLFFLGWTLHITNIEKTILETQSVGLVYKVRWYIELVFKSWKSYHGLTQISGKRKERIECFIYGRLIMMAIMAFLNGSVKRHLWSTRRRETSFLKLVRHFQVKAQKFLRLMMDPVSLACFLMDEFFEASRLCKMNIRKRLSTNQMLRRIQIPCYSTA